MTHLITLSLVGCFDLCRDPTAKLDIIIGGGSGFAGQALASSLRDQGHDVTIVSRSSRTDRGTSGSGLTWEDVERDGVPPSTDAVINLAGSDMIKSQKLWACEYMEECVVGRAGTAKLLAEAISKSEHAPSVSIAKSPVNFYPPVNKYALSKRSEYEETAIVSDRDCARSVMAHRRASNASDVASAGVRGVVLCLQCVTAVPSSWCGLERTCSAT